MKTENFCIPNSLLQKCNNDSVTVHLFLHLLTTSDDSGAATTTLRKLAEELKTTVKKITTRLAKLENAGLVATKQKGNKKGTKREQKGTFVTICNYESYAVLDIGYGNSKGTTREQQRNNTKETNKENLSPTPPIKENKKENSPSLHLTVEPPPSKIYREVVELWDNICTSSPRLRAHSQARQNKVLCRVKEMGGYTKAIATITEMFTVVQANSFYTGDNGRGWVAGFDWFFENSTNWCKVIERVHNSKSNGQKHNSTSKAEHIASERERIMREVASAAPRECDAPSWLD